MGLKKKSDDFLLENVFNIGYNIPYIINSISHIRKVVILFN